MVGLESDHAPCGNVRQQSGRFLWAVSLKQEPVQGCNHTIAPPLGIPRLQAEEDVKLFTYHAEAFAVQTGVLERPERMFHALCNFFCPYLARVGFHVPEHCEVS